MNVEEQPYLVAYTNGQPVLLINTPENTAAYFAEHILEDVRLCTPDNNTIVSSCGPFIDRCTDMNYLNNQLVPKLTAYQINPSLKPDVQYIRNNGRNSALSR